MSASPHIGIVELAASNWSAGASYTRMLTYSLGQAAQNTDVRVSVVSPDGKYSVPDGLPVRTVALEPEPPKPFRGQNRVRRWLHLPEPPAPLMATAQKHGLSVLLPLWDLPPAVPGVKTIGWIPDFQHVYLPEYFSPLEIEQRNGLFQHIAASADAVMLSSQTAAEHFAAFAPAFWHKAHVLPFPSLFAFQPPDGEAASVLKRFHLPQKFVLVANQFWRHKNHAVVVEAVRRLAQSGIHVPVVMTGLPSDVRDPSNKAVSGLLQAIAAANLAGQVTVLGQVDYPDLIQLMRMAAVIVQPSRFEGWSTIVEDAKSIGRPLLCSNLAVHREQAPNALGFFDCDNADGLADLLRQHWPALLSGPDLACEAAAVAQEREFAREHGQKLLHLCRELTA